MDPLSLQMAILIIALAFFAELIDSSLGMGYGTSLTPILLLMGFPPLAVVPAVLFSELVTGFLAGFTHHSFGNVDFKPKTIRMSKIIEAVRTYGIRESAKRGLPQALRIVLLLSFCSIIGTVASVYLAVALPSFYIKLYIGILVLAVGIAVFVTRKKEFRFSWRRITLLGIVASFNKGISGGGYGPVVTSGQLVSGVNGKNAVAITSLSEGLTCLIGVFLYIVTKNTVIWQLAPFLTFGAVLSVLPSVWFVKRINPAAFKVAIAVLSMTLGLWTIIKTGVFA